MHLNKRLNTNTNMKKMPKQTFTCSKLKIKTLEKGAKYVGS